VLIFTRGRSQHFRADLGCSGADAAPTVWTLPIPRLDFLSGQVWLMISRADRRAEGLLASAIPKLRAELGYATTVHIAQGVTADTRHGVVIARSQGSSCLRGHLLLWPAPAPIRSLSCSPRLPRSPSSMNKCGDRGPASSHHGKRSKLFGESIQRLVILL
jgi:hypothetical protein